MSYIVVQIKNNSEQIELQHSKLWDLGASGIEEEKDLTKAYFAADVNIDLIESEFSEYIISIEAKEDENWMENWKENFKAQHIANTFIIKPTWEDVEAENKIIIDIDPKMAFGTGTHETTQLVLTLLAKYHHTDARVFDFGTGSGILSIAAEKMGSSEILAIDNDIESIINANENKQLNNCKYVSFNKKSLHSIDKSFNLILANINKHVLMSENTTLINILENNGILILSGLLHEDEVDIKAKYEALEFIEKEEKNEWIALVYKKS